MHRFKLLYLTKKIKKRMSKRLIPDDVEEIYVVWSTKDLKTQKLFGEGWSFGKRSHCRCIDSRHRCFELREVERFSILNNQSLVPTLYEKDKAPAKPFSAEKGLRTSYQWKNAKGEQTVHEEITFDCSRLRKDKSSSSSSIFLTISKSAKNAKGMV